MRYTPSLVPDSGVQAFLGAELDRISRALRNLDVDTITTTHLGSRLEPLVTITTSATATPDLLGGSSPMVALMGDAATWFNIEQFENTASGPVVLFKKSRGSPIGAQSIVNNGDLLGAINFYASNNAAWAGAAYLQVLMAGTVQGSPLWLPTAMYFGITAPNTSTPYQAMVLDPAGYLRVNDTSAVGLAYAGTVFTHGGFIAAATSGAGKYAVLYFYSNALGTQRGWIGHNGTIYELNNSLNSGEFRFTTLDNTNATRTALRIGGNVANTGIGFHNTVPIVKPTVTGAKGGNAALASLCTALANYGLITDSTT